MERMSHLVKAIAALAGHRAPKLMPVDSFDFFGMTLSDDYSLGAWLRDPAVERDQRLFLQIISTKMTFDRGRMRGGEGSVSLVRLSRAGS